MTAGMSVERLKRLDSFLTENYIDAGRIPGALMLVARHGEIVHCSPLGNMDAERAKPTREDTIYRIYSMSKPITSVGLMMLFEEGRFHLNDPVHEFLPEWKDAEVWVSGDASPFETRPVDRAMTIGNLLSHQAGLTYGFMDDHPIDRAYENVPPYSGAGSLAKWSASLAQIPLFYSPGTAWRYSVATDLCGYLTEVISGKPFGEYLEERIFEPLGMTDTAFNVPDAKIDRFAACYEPDAEKGGYRLQDDPETSDFRAVPTVPSGGGGLLSTAGDYVRFCQMLLNGGALDGVRILGRKTLDLMTSNHLPDGASILDRGFAGAFSEVSYGGVGFGLGFAVLQDPVKYQINGSTGTFSWGGAASTAFWVDPTEDLIGVFMTQLLPSDTYPVRQEIQAMVYASLED